MTTALVLVVAAMLGLPYAFASHFAPAEMMEAIRVYRDSFKPSAQLDRPYVMLGFNAFAADTESEARLLATSIQQAFVNLRSGRPGRLTPPKPGLSWGAPERAMLSQVLTCSAVGSPETVRKWMARFLAETRADEIIVAGQIYEHAARLRSYELAAEVLRSVSQA